VRSSQKQAQEAGPSPFFTSEVWTLGFMVKRQENDLVTTDLGLAYGIVFVQLSMLLMQQ
jgi:hypothetical protein